MVRRQRSALRPQACLQAVLLAADTADALDPAQVQRVARLAYTTAWLLADR